MGINILPPDINESDVGFTIVTDNESLNNQAIRFGLSAIKNVGTAAIEAILLARNEKKFISLGDFFTRVDARKVNKKVLESLTKVGAFSAYGSRASVLASLDELRAKVKPNSAKLGNQQDLFGDFESKETQAPVFQLDTNIEEFSDEQLASLERELLGFSLSAKPIEEILSGFRGFYTHKIGDIVSGDVHSSKVKFACIVTSARVVITKASQSEMAFVRLSDSSGAIDGVVFPRLFKLSRGLWVDHKPLLITGKIEHRDESPSVLIETVQTETDLQGQEGVFTISIPGSATPDNLKNLKQILLMHPGNQKVMLSFEGNREVPLSFGVSWSENLSQSISELFFGAKDLPH
jgi:DNA polymerase-3 subunit alpha